MLSEATSILVGTDRPALWLVGGVGGLLTVATAIGEVLKRTARTDGARRTIANLNARTRAWWVMALLFGGAIALGHGAACVLFALISFLALREMVTLSPTRRADHHTLFWAFFVVVPIQYWLVYIRWYGLFAIFIPVWVFLFLAIRSTLTGDWRHYLERVAKIQWAVFVCVYCVSHAAALLMLQLPAFETKGWQLLVFLVIVVQMSDVLQYVWGKLLGRHKIAPNISPNKTVEGFAGGVLTATALGAGLWWLTPMNPWHAAMVSLVICLMGFAGGIVMSAIKRDAGVKDYGQLIEGHGGVMDRVDSLSFAAPVFFHLMRYYFESAV